MPHSSTISFISYWRGLQDAPDIAPLRERFDPACLKHLVPQMLMLSTHEDRLNFRLSGGFLVAFHGQELKGQSFLDRFRSPFLTTVQSAIGLAARRQQPLVLTLSAPWEAAKNRLPDMDEDLFQSETVQFEVCLCPMLNAKGDVDRLVGIYQTLSPSPRNLKGRVGPYTLMSARIYEHHHLPRPGHLRLIAVEGRLIA